MGVQAIENLMKKRGKFDYILLETTGLADPGPIASMFWLDDALCSEIFLDGIVTLVDAKFSMQQLQEVKPEGTLNEAVRQVAFADRIIVNKTDLVDEPHLRDLEDTLLSINAAAQIKRTTRSKIDLDFILDIHAFDVERALTIDPHLGHDDDDDHHHHHHHQHSLFDTVLSLNFTSFFSFLPFLIFSFSLPAHRR